MKLIIITLTMIFISFGAKAYNSDIESMYGWCTTFKNNNFKYKGLNSDDLMVSLVCETAMQSYSQLGASTCENIQIANKAAQMNTKDDHWKVKVFLNGLEKDSANAPVSLKQTVLSFSNYAEKNPNDFGKRIYQKREEFLGKIFPCDIEKYIKNPPKIN